MLDTEFKRALSNAKLPSLMRLQDLRRSATMQLLGLEVLPRIAMEILVHSDVAQTRNAYSHVMEE
jgi:integrase